MSLLLKLSQIPQAPRENHGLIFLMLVHVFLSASLAQLFPECELTGIDVQHCNTDQAYCQRKITSAPAHPGANLILHHISLGWMFKRNCQAAEI